MRTETSFCTSSAIMKLREKLWNLESHATAAIKSNVLILSFVKEVRFCLN